MLILGFLALVMSHGVLAAPIPSSLSDLSTVGTTSAAANRGSPDITSGYLRRQLLSFDPSVLGGQKAVAHFSESPDVGAGFLRRKGLGEMSASGLADDAFGPLVADRRFLPGSTIGVPSVCTKRGCQQFSHRGMLGYSESWGQSGRQHWAFLTVSPLNEH
ncbi:hypothetical protein OF83DRAFT_692228 [Amylostereum chailletii]|nr:hypothetical protein OF83DRAFT_692228 [Amylostereum chailletii]